MPSTVIHLCIAKQINKKFKFDEQLLYLGSIAPDISKFSNFSKLKTHFSNQDYPDEPIIKDFYKKYQNKFNDPFILGYFIHLIADDLWNKYIYAKNNSPKEVITKLLYIDYYSLNKKLISEYQIDLSKLNNYDYNTLSQIDDLSFDQLPTLITETINVVNSSKEQEPMIITIDDTRKFITDCCNIIIENFLF